MEPRPYDTDLSDEQFALIEPFLPRPKKMGRPPADLRAVLNAILYLVRTGCQWRLLPKDFPPWSTVHTWYRRWRTDGTWERLHEALRQQVRRQAGRRPPVGQDRRPGRGAGVRQRQEGPGPQAAPVGGQPGPDLGRARDGRRRA